MMIAGFVLGDESLCDQFSGESYKITIIVVNTIKNPQSTRICQSEKNSTKNLPRNPTFSILKKILKKHFLTVNLTPTKKLLRYTQMQNLMFM